MDKVNTVFIHADGGNLIGKLRTLIPNAVFVMDGFHSGKDYKKLLRLNGAAPYSGAIRKAVREKDFEFFIRFCASIDEKKDGKDNKTLSEIIKYFRNNWYSITERLNSGHCGSCTEPLISHIFSERLSRNPRTLSGEGLSKRGCPACSLRTATSWVSRSKEERAEGRNAIRNVLSYTTNMPKSRSRKFSAIITVGAYSRTNTLRQV